MSTADVSVIGTGTLGGVIARRLAADGMDVVLWNRSRDKAKAVLHEIAGTGISAVARSAPEAVLAAPIVISCLRDEEALLSVLTAGGMALSVKGRTIIDMTTLAPTSAKAVGSAITSAGGRYVEAPVVGSVPAVMNRKAAILIGGDAEDVDRVSILLSKLGQLLHVGEVGTAAKAKLLANAMLTIVVAASSELSAAAHEVGLSPEVAYWVLSKRVPLIKAWRDWFEQGHSTQHIFNIGGLSRDAELASDLFVGRQGAAPIFELAVSLIHERAKLSPADDIGELFASSFHRAENGARATGERR